MPTSGETQAHRDLKCLAAGWARANRLLVFGTEVRLPRCNYRADVAAATSQILSMHAYTAVFECKASRADFLRDAAPDLATKQKILALHSRLMGLRQLIGEHRPDL